jgi:23S rRNA (guanosine2251-2'-O)-methyltransferase
LDLTEVQLLLFNAGYQFGSTQALAMTEIIYGIHPVREALASRGQRVKEIWAIQGGGNRAVQETLAEARALDIKVRFHERRRLDNRVGTSNHQGILAFLSPFSFVSVEAILALATGEDPALILVLDGIQDPQNLGAIIRTAHVCGVHGVIVPKDRAASLTGAVDRASAGALEHTNVARVTNLRRTLDQLKEGGVWVVGLTMESTHHLYDLDLCQPTALVIGSEASGIRPLVKKTCDLLAALPQRGQLDSLNAAAAGAMALYEAVRQRLTAAHQK